jgi:hypothetical protein
VTYSQKCPYFRQTALFNNCSLSVTDQLRCSAETLPYCGLLGKRLCGYTGWPVQNRVRTKKKPVHLPYVLLNMKQVGTPQSLLDCPLSTCIGPFGMSEVFVVLLSVSFCFSFVLLVSFGTRLRWGPDSSVGVATGYGLDCPGIESRWGARFSAPVETGPGAHPASYTMGAGSFPGAKWPGRGVDHPPPSSTEVKERVEVYLYSPFGLSWPVLGWTLPLLYLLHAYFKRSPVFLNEWNNDSVLLGWTLTLKMKALRNVGSSSNITASHPRGNESPTLLWKPEVGGFRLATVTSKSPWPPPRGGGGGEPVSYQLYLTAWHVAPFWCI